MSVKLRKRKLGSGKTSLYLDIYHNGHRHCEFLKLYLTKDRIHNKEILEKARNIRAKRELELQLSDHGLVPNFKKKINFVDYCEKVLNEKIEKGIKEVDSWESAIKHLREFTSGRIAMSAVTEDWLEEFKTYLLSKVSINSASVYFSKIKACVKQAVKEKILSIDPSANVPPIRMEETQRVYLEIDEIKKLAATPCKRHELKRAFLFSCYTGLRISDIKRLKWSNVKGDKLEFRQKKTRGFEYLPLSETAKRILFESNQSDSIKAKIFALPNTKVFSLPTQEHMNVLLKKWCRDAGIDKKISFHVARHTFATLALTQGADLYTVSKLLGHRDIQTTQIYAKIIDEKKREAVNKLPEIEMKI